MEEKDEHYYKLGNRLTYVLRYGAMKEGLEVHHGGYVNLDDLMSLKLLRHDDKDDVLEFMSTTKSSDGQYRYEVKQTPEFPIMVRRRTGRMMEPSPYHFGTGVQRLVNICLNKVCSKIKDYDLEDFPDEYLLRMMFMKLKHEKKLTNTVLRSLISSAVEKYDFHNVYITASTLQLVCERCPNLKSLNLKGCGYVVTDDVVYTLAKKLSCLQELSLSYCTSLTDKTLKNLLKFNTPLKTLTISFCRNFTESELKLFVKGCPTLNTLVVHGFSFINENFNRDLKLLHDENTNGVLNVYHRNYEKEHRLELKKQKENKSSDETDSSEYM